MAITPTAVDVSVGDNARYVDWTAIFAGAVLASAISFVLFTFGAGLGLSLTSPYPGESVSIVAFAIALGLWVLWVSVSSFIAGAYLTGRLRRRIGDATEHEVEVRDAAHGLLVWAVSVLLGALIAAWVTGGVASKTADVASGVATGASAAAAQQVTEQADPTIYWTDTLFRPGTAAGAAPAATSEGATDQSRQTAGRILSSRITGGKLADDDRAYLTRLVMDSTGLSEADAGARVDAATAGVSQAKAEAQRLADKARKFGILITFLTAASLAVGAAASWWAAIVGGQHRDRATDFGHFFGRTRS
jgi:uncharacterized membrane protein YoaK (UPF0700 family)